MGVSKIHTPEKLGREGESRVAGGSAETKGRNSGLRSQWRQWARSTLRLGGAGKRRRSSVGADAATSSSVTHSWHGAAGLTPMLPHPVSCYSYWGDGSCWG